MLSNEVAYGIRCTVGAVSEEIAKFAEYLDKFFDCLNVSNPSVGKQSKNTFKNLGVTVFSVIVYANISFRISSSNRKNS